MGKKIVSYSTVTLLEILQELDKLDWRSLILIEGEPPLNTNTRCVLLQYDEDGHQELQDHLFDIGFYNDILVQTVRNVKVNAGLYLEEVTLQQLLKAVSYYVEYDAYYDFSED